MHYSENYDIDLDLNEEINEEVKNQIDEELGIKTELNELQCFQLFFSEKIINSLVEESNNYYKKILIEKYGTNYMEIVLSKNSFGTYPFLYVTRGISREDILAFIGMRIYTIIFFI